MLPSFITALWRAARTKYPPRAIAPPAGMRYRSPKNDYGRESVVVVTFRGPEKPSSRRSDRMDTVNATVEELSKGASRRLVDHVAGTLYKSLAPEVIHSYKRAFLDFLTCAVAGSAMPVSRALLSYYEKNDATRVATVIGSGVRLSAPNAALVNGANTHGLDFDDGHTHGSAHPSGAIFPAVLAVAEQRGCGANEIILAVVIGYDIMLRIAAAMHPGSARLSQYCNCRGVGGRGWRGEPAQARHSRPRSEGRDREPDDGYRSRAQVLRQLRAGHRPRALRAIARSGVALRRIE